MDAPFVVSAPSSWVYQGTGVPDGASFPHLVGVEYDRVDPAYPVQRPIEVLSHSPLTCDGRRQLRRLRLLHARRRRRRLQQRHDALGRGDLRRPAARHRRRHPAFVRQVTTNVLLAFAHGPAAAKYQASDNLAAIDEPTAARSPPATSSNRGKYSANRARSLSRTEAADSPRPMFLVLSRKTSVRRCSRLAMTLRYSESAVHQKEMIRPEMAVDCAFQLPGRAS